MYADESGIHGQADYCLLAGYRGSPEQWKRFKQAWNAVLAKYRVPEFHSKDYFNRGLVSAKRNPYTDWADTKADRFLDELLLVIRRHKVRPVGASVDIKSFNTLSYGERCLVAGHPTSKRITIGIDRIKPAPYHVAMRVLVEDALAMAHPNAEIHFVLAEQKDLQHHALQAYVRLKEIWADGSNARDIKNASRLKGMGLESPKDFPALQAADLFTNRWYNTIRHHMQVSRRNSRIMDHLTHARNDMPLIDANGLERHFESAGIGPAERGYLQGLKEPS